MLTRKTLIVRGVFRASAATTLLAALAWAGAVSAQESSTQGSAAQPSSTGNPAAQEPTAQEASVPTQPPAQTKSPLPERTKQNANAPCVYPPPVLRWQDYQGKFNKTVGVFARRLDRTSVHPQSHYKPGVALCTLKTKEKFIIFVENSFDPLAFLTAGFNAGIDQAQNVQHSYGQGAEGYGKRFGAEFVNQTSSEFFKWFLYPTIFSEDPRYYRLGPGSAEIRMRHALLHVFIAHHQNGSRMFNISEWLGSTSAIVLSNTYEPNNSRGVGATAERLVTGVAWDAGFDVLREFWPEIAHKLKLPFRGEQPPTSSTQPSATQ